MHRLRKALVWALLALSGATASAQEISLGQPTPLPADAPRVVRALIPMTPGTFPQPPKVVRGALPYFDDEPKMPLPLKEVDGKVLPPVFPVFPVLPAPTDAGRADVPLPPAAPLEVVPLPVQPLPVPEAPKIIDVDKDGKATVPEPPRFQPLKAQAASAAVHEPTPSDEHVIILGDSDSPLWGDASRPPTRFYAQSEYLLWWTRGMHLPPLAITDSPTTPIDSLGVLGNGTTRILFGDNDTSTGPDSGGRFTLGYALDNCGIFSIEGTFFFLGRNNDGANLNSNNFPVLGRPFGDLNDGVVSREFTAIPLSVGAPFAATGTLAIRTTSDLLGAEANLKTLLWCGGNYQISGLAGFRFLDLNESVRITENSVQQLAFADIDASIQPGDQTSVFDSFTTHNRFYGGQVGASGEWNFGRFSLEGCVKLAIGVTQQNVDIDGGQQILTPSTGRVQSFVGGLYAVPSNIGSHSQNQFGFVPELGLKVNYQLTDHISVFVGYDFLYWSSVVRPGDQIDQVLDLNQVPNSGRPYPQASQVRPVVPFQTSSYWAQGVNAGVLFRY